MIEKLKEAREKKGYTQQEMAKRLGKKSKSWYHMIENGEIPLTIDIAKELCKILGINPIIFFEDLVQ
jgi:transcriptional regulator with XRE-family HTH domain